MRSLFLSLSLVLIPLTSFAQDDLIPLEVGNSWTYSGTLYTGVGGMGVTVKQPVTAKVVQASKAGEFSLYHMVWRDDKKVITGQWIRNHKGNLVVDRNNSFKGLFVLPYQHDDTEVDLRFAKGTDAAPFAVKVSTKQGKKELVKVPFGSFQAIPVSAKVVVSDQVVVETKVWYAPKVGVVKVTEKVTTAATAIVERKLVLEKFTKAGASEAPKTSEPKVDTPKPEAPKESVELNSKSWPYMIQQAAKNGPRSKAWVKLQAWLSTVGKRSKAATGNDLPVDLSDLEKQAVKGLALSSALEDSCTVSKGDVSALYLSDCVVIVDGNVNLSSYASNVVLIVTGNVNIASYADETLIVAGGSVRVGSYISDSVLEASSVRAGAYIEDSVCVNTSKVSAGARESSTKKTTKVKLGAAVP